ncbi:MAG: hypothetical protein QM662_16035 [Gordonia sp. (in: high G+C Gram-positive bacteria)]
MPNHSHFSPSPIDSPHIETLRDEWLARGLHARPADRSAAESALAELYRRIRRPEPEFHWAPSPPAALEHIAAHGLSAPLTRDLLDRPAGRIATMLAASRHRMDAACGAGPDGEGLTDPWSALLGAHDALRQGVSPGAVLRTQIRDSLRTSLIDGVAGPLRELCPALRNLVTAYGQQEADRVGFHAIARDLGVAEYRDDDTELLEIQSTLVAATGWWWAFDDVCVFAERPSTLRTEPFPAAARGERRLHHPTGRAVEFPDLRGVFALHGTRVPEWVVTAPSVDRISAEPHPAIRSRAIDRIGWDAYLDAAGVRLIDKAENPALPGGVLALYTAPRGSRGRGRILVTDNGSPDGGLRWCLRVPDLASAVEAAAWTYGLTDSAYRAAGAAGIQGDLVVVPQRLRPDVAVPAKARPVPVGRAGLALPGSFGGPAHRLIAFDEHARWTDDVHGPVALGILETHAVTHLVHPGHPPLRIPAGRHVVGRRRERTGR